MYKFSLGMFSEDLRGFSEGIQAVLGLNGLEIFIGFNRPTAQETLSIKEKGAEFRLVVKDDIVFLLCRFGKLNWMDCAVRVQEGVSIHNIISQNLTNNLGYKTTITFADVPLGEVKAIRMIELGNEFSLTLNKLMIEKAIMSKEQRVVAIKKIQRTYSTKQLLQYSCSSYKITR